MSVSQLRRKVQKHRWHRSVVSWSKGTNLASYVHVYFFSSIRHLHPIPLTENYLCSNVPQMFCCFPPSPHLFLTRGNKHCNLVEFPLFFLSPSSFFLSIKQDHYSSHFILSSKVYNSGGGGGSASGGIGRDMISYLD